MSYQGLVALRKREFSAFLREKKGYLTSVRTWRWWRVVGGRNDVTVSFQ